VLEIGRRKPGCARFRGGDSAVSLHGALCHHGSGASSDAAYQLGRTSVSLAVAALEAPPDITGATDPSRTRTKESDMDASMWAAMKMITTIILA